MINFRPVTTMVLFIIGSALYSIYEFRDNWSSYSFFIGFSCGVPIVTCVLSNRHIRMLIIATGLLLFAIMWTGYVHEFERDRLFFSAMSLGVILGWVPALLFVREKAVDFLHRCAKLDGYLKMADFIESKQRS